MVRAKVAKVTTKNGKKAAQASRVNRKRTTPIGISNDKVAKMAQDTQTKVIDKTTGRAIRQHRVALRELERH